MELQINDVAIAVVKMQQNRMLFARNSSRPYLMSWSRSTNSWQFMDATASAELGSHESEISDFIIRYERSIS